MQYLSIALLSMFGALCRYGISLLFLETHFQTVLINLVGAFLLGYCVKAFEYVDLNKALKTGITTGFLGSFTTFSTLSLEVVHFIHSGQWYLVTVYLVITIIGGIVCTALGMKVGAR